MAKRKKRRKKTKKSKVSYVCSNCGTREEIPIDVLEYFDDINPEQLLYSSHQFRCEKCVNGIMHPEEDEEIIIKRYDLFD